MVAFPDVGPGRFQQPARSCQKYFKVSTMKKPELLAPAGNMEKLRIAIHYGADAVYLGGKNYGLRNLADNFTPAEMAEGVAYAHDRGVKVYLTMNIYPDNPDIEPLYRYFDRAGAHPVRCLHRRRSRRDRHHLPRSPPDVPSIFRPRPIPPTGRAPSSGSGRGSAGSTWRGRCPSTASGR